MRCGHCKSDNVTVPHVRTCATTTRKPKPIPPPPSARKSPLREAQVAMKAINERHAVSPVRTGVRVEDLYAEPDENTERCRKCMGTGMFITMLENDQPKGPGGPCYACNGKGRQSDCGPVKHAVRALEIASGERTPEACCDRVRNDLYWRYGVRYYGD